MKTALFLLSLALSMNVLSQNIQPVFKFQSLILSIEDELLFKDWEDQIPFPDYSHCVNKKRYPVNMMIPTDRSKYQLYDSIIGWNLGDKSWSYDAKETGFIYDASYNLSGYTQLVRQNGEWKNNKKYERTYDSQNNMTKNLEQRWIYDGWVNDNQNLLAYDQDNNLAYEFYLKWDGSFWQNDERYIYTYNIDNKISKELAQDWDQNGTWDNNQQTFYAYDENNNLEFISVQFWNGTYWSDYARIFLRYNTENFLIGLIGHRWNQTDWENNWQYFCNYNENHDLINELLQTWDGYNWVDECQSNYYFDEKNNITGGTFQSWSGEEWLIFLQIRFTYDENDLKLSYTRKFFDDGGTVVRAADSTHYYFQTVLGINDPLKDEEHATIYPNPNNGIFYINSTGTICSVELYNLMGEQVYIQENYNGQGIIGINLAGYPKGMYLVKINGILRTCLRKTIIQ